jgi:hypothetical protein
VCSGNSDAVCPVGYTIRASRRKLCSTQQCTATKRQRHSLTKMLLDSEYSDFTDGEDG